MPHEIASGDVRRSARPWASTHMRRRIGEEQDFVNAFDWAILVFKWARDLLRLMNALKRRLQTSDR